MTSELHPVKELDRSSALHVKAIVITVIGLVVVFGGLFFWRTVRTALPSPGALPPIPVAVAIVEPTEVPVSLEAVGTLRAVREVTLSSEVAGRVVNIHFEPGSRVAAGTLLVQLYDGSERADHKAAQAKAAFAQLQLARSQQLAPSGAEPREQLQQRQAEYDQAQAEVAQLDARLVQKQVRAPFAGELGIRHINLGQYLNPGDTIATLTALDSLYVEFTLPQQNLAVLTRGATVTLTSDAWPGRSFTAKVNAIEPKIGADTRNVTVQAVVANRDHALRPGMYVTASLMLAPQRNALAVPATTIQTSATGEMITVVRGKNPRQAGKAQIVPVTTGQRFGNQVVVTSGLQPGDVVVTEGQLRIPPGADVVIAGTAAGVR